MTKVTKEVPATAADLQLKVEIDDDVFQKIMHWINKSNYEVSGLGKVVYDAQRKCLRVIDAILLDQENTTGTTEIEAAAISKAMYELRDTEGTLNWWWHSHVKMDVFWSGTDHNAIKVLGSGGWFLSTVFNQREEMLSAYYQSGPIQVFADKLPTEIIRSFDAELVNGWDKEYAEKVKNKTWHRPNIPGVGNFSGQGTYGGGYSGGDYSRSSWEGNRWGGMGGGSNKPYVAPKLPSYLVDDDDDGVGDYIPPSQRGKRGGKSDLLVDGIEEQDAFYEEGYDDVEEEDVDSAFAAELAAWDDELDELINLGLFPEVLEKPEPQPLSKKKNKKKKGA